MFHNRQQAVGSLNVGGRGLEGFIDSLPFQRLSLLGQEPSPNEILAVKPTIERWLSLAGTALVSAELANRQRRLRWVAVRWLGHFDG